MNIRSFLMALVTSLFILKAHAATFCVTNSQEFQDALDQAATNGQDNLIRLVSGNYGTYSNGLPNQGFTYESWMSSKLIISGGWQISNHGVCTLPRVPDSAHGTVLNGNTQDQVLLISAGDDNADISITNLSVTGGRSSIKAGIDIKGFTNNSRVRDVMIDRVLFYNNQSGNYSALFVKSTGRVDIKNSLFRHNIVNNYHTVWVITDDSDAVYFTNNTVTKNHTSDPNGASGVRLRNTGSGGLVVANNIFWDNDTWDIEFSGTEANHHMMHNIYQTATGHGGIVMNNNSEDPQFNLNYSLKAHSPAIDVGITPDENNPNPPIELDWTVGESDLFAKTRTQGLGTDLGPTEFTEIIFSNDFE